MRTVHQLLCLAKSWKNGGFCIAGKNDNNQWVRTITANPSNNAIFHHGNAIQPLDFFQATTINHAPQGHQTENHIIDESVIFTVNGHCAADDLDDYEEEKPRFLPRTTNSNKVVPMRRGSGMEVSLIKPTSLDDAKEICDYLLAGKAVVLNMEGIHTETAQRIIDFTSGSTYSMNGNLQKISNYIFIATPQSVELSGDFQDLLTGGNLDVSGLNIHL